MTMSKPTALSHKPHDPALNLGCADTLKKLGRNSAAAPYYRTYLTLTPQGTHAQRVRRLLQSPR